MGQHLDHIVDRIASLIALFLIFTIAFHPLGITNFIQKLEHHTPHVFVFGDDPLAILLHQFHKLIDAFFCPRLNFFRRIAHSLPNARSFCM